MNSKLIITLFFIIAKSRCERRYQTYALNLHNGYRSVHGAMDLKYNETLSKQALMCAKYYSRIHKIDHSCKYKFHHGENLAMFGSSNGAPFAVKSLENAINGWYIESYEYNYAYPRESTSTAIFHFTQMVWQSTEYLGFAVFRNESSKRSYVVAIYEAKGNILDYGPDAFKWFRGNVSAPVENDVYFI